MSRCRRFLGLAVTSFALAVSAPAQAELIAGWDFSQYFSDGQLSIDGATYTSTLGANYSSLDPTYNLGIESAVFGTMYVDGQFGSTSVVGGTGSEPFLPSSAIPGGSLVSNLDAPIQQFGDNPFDSLELLAIEGQLFTNYIAMTALGDVNVVFEADRGVATGGGNWILSFGARTQAGEAGVGIQASTNGGGYASAGTAALTTTDTAYTFDLGPATGPTMFVRLAFTGAAATAPVIDNVAISVPEAGAAAQLAAAGMCVAALARRRARA